MNNDDVNRAIREEYGLGGGEKEDQGQECPFCGTQNQSEYSECRQCGKLLSLEKQVEKEQKQDVLERLTELEDSGVLDKLEELE